MGSNPTGGTHARHHPGHPEQEDSAKESAPQPGADHHEEAGADPTAPAMVPPDPAETRPEQPPAAITVGGDTDPTTCATVTDRATQQLQAAAAPHAEPHPPEVTSVDHRRRWILGAAAAVIVAASVVVVTTTGVLAHTNATGSIGPSPLIPGNTFTETVHTSLGARTYSKPHTLSGEWRRIPNGTNVQVSCEVTAPSVPSVGLYWYRIANPPPWQNYYSPANSYLNGDPPDGSSPTHAVDQAVPECPH